MSTQTISPIQIKNIIASNKEEWPTQGDWTYEDYCRLPDDGWRYEIIEGELFMSPAPKTIHQKICGKIIQALLNLIDEQGCGEAFGSPIDVILPGQANPVQPDILFISKDRLDIVKEDKIIGAPDLVVEVLSPGNWLIDRREKFKVYEKVGVHEYWIVDPEKRIIELYSLREKNFVLVGKFGADDLVRSEILPGFEVEVNAVCPRL